MNRINLFRNLSVKTKAFRSTPFHGNPATLDSVTWGKTNFDTTTSTLVFAALLIVCSVAVGCSSDKPKPASSNNQVAMTQPVPPIPTPVAPALPTPAKPVHKKVVRKAPVTVTYEDKTSGVSFQYPRKYSLETGDAANQLVSSDPVPMNFVQPGGVAVAAVTLPTSVYPNGDLATAFFNVSLNKTLTAEQCGEFSEAKPTAPADPEAPVISQPSKLMIGDMELQSSETFASQGTREESSKYYHVFENGACYEFALKVATTGAEGEGGKHVDRKEVFQRLEKILTTVKINPTTEMTASAPATANAPAAATAPAQ
ncbi:MAG: hypothetical protein WB799_01030 [Candidatus Sulfotelmatobacter sp.]